MDERMVSYAGKNYLLLWKGRTKFGQRAKLGFLRGPGFFWVSKYEVEAPLNPCYAATYPY